MWHTKKMDVSIIIPAFNAGHCLKGTVERACDWLGGRNEKYEIIIVDDGSADETWQIFEALKNSCPNVHGLRLEKNRGKGAAVKKGMLAATGGICAFTDADGSTDISYLDAARAKLKEGFDVVIATRSRLDAPGARQAVPQNWLKRYMGIAGNIFIQLTGLWGIWDTQCGFKVFGGQTAARLFARSRIDRWAFDVEVLLLAKKMGLKIAAIPVEWRNNPKSTVKPWTYIQMLADVVRMRISMLAGKYNINQ